MVNSSNLPRVRIAPSPTGLLHIGTARSALFNALFAKKYSGTFVLRIEDTDVSRSDPKFEKDIVEGLMWLGIIADEGPTQGGPFGPYRQSERQTIYSDHIRILKERGAIYPCFCSKEELEADRKTLELTGKPPVYIGRCRDRKSTDEEIATFIREQGREPIYRFRTPQESITFHDLVRGDVAFDAVLFGDFAVTRGLETPLYNLAVVIDDLTMKITHVIRGEDHISNTPKQILLFRAFEQTPPLFAHLPLLLNADRTKLSKRKNAVSVNDYRAHGYLPEAMINFLALLGWNSKTDQEYFSFDELARAFDLSGVQKGGAIFSVERLNWFNAHYLKQRSVQEFISLATPFLERKGDSLQTLLPPQQIQWARIEQERVKRLDEVGEETQFVFLEALDYVPSLLIWKKSDQPTAKASLIAVLGWIETRPAEDLGDAALLEAQIKKWIAAQSFTPGEVLWPLRVSLTGKERSPSPFDALSVLGKQRSIARVQDAIRRL
jgi:nondiscriminating glutamyl-tRNA synthetase